MATGKARRRLKLTVSLLRDNYDEERELLEARQNWALSIIQRAALNTRAEEEQEWYFSLKLTRPG